MTAFEKDLCKLFSKYTIWNEKEIYGVYKRLNSMDKTFDVLNRSVATNSHIDDVCDKLMMEE